jgi:hypothetical protein
MNHLAGLYYILKTFILQMFMQISIFDNFQHVQCDMLWIYLFDKIKYSIHLLLF